MRRFIYHLLFFFLSDILAAEMSDDSDAEENAEDEGDVAETAAAGAARKGKAKAAAKPQKHGITLDSCKHVFCGVSIFFSLERDVINVTDLYSTIRLVLLNQSTTTFESPLILLRMVRNYLLPPSLLWVLRLNFLWGAP
jgi:hypothetical protein